MKYLSSRLKGRVELHRLKTGMSVTAVFLIDLILRGILPASLALVTVFPPLYTHKHTLPSAMEIQSLLLQMSAESFPLIRLVYMLEHQPYSVHGGTFLDA